MAPAIWAKPMKPAASPARVGLGITAPATEPGSTMPAPRVSSTCGSSRPGTEGPAASRMARVSTAPVATSAVPMPTRRAGPHFRMRRLLRMAPAINPETMPPKTSPYWVGLRPSWPTNTREEPAITQNMAP